MLRDDIPGSETLHWDVVPGILIRARTDDMDDKMIYKSAKTVIPTSYKKNFSRSNRICSKDDKAIDQDYGSEEIL